jgi:hypothetical protein
MCFLVAGCTINVKDETILHHINFCPGSYIQKKSPPLLCSDISENAVVDYTVDNDMNMNVLLLQKL